MANKINIEYSSTSLKNIIDRIKNGEIKIPPFQRMFDWSGKDMARFANSITKGEPFGSIMLWNDSSNSTDIKQTNHYFNKLSKGNKSSTGSTYLIDGQQRITTFIMLYLLHNNDTFHASLLTKALTIFFDIDKMEFYSGKKRKTSFPAHNFFFEDFPTLRKSVSHNLEMGDISEKRELEIMDIFEELQDIYGEFNSIPIGRTEVYSSDLDEVIRIFTLINTKGKKLSAFNIVHAYYISSKFDLDTKFTKIIKNFKSKKFGSWGEFKKPQLLLYGYSALHGTISNADILRRCQESNGIPKKDIEYFKNDFENDLKIVVDILGKHIGFPSLDFLPSSNIFNILMRVIQVKKDLYERDYIIIRDWVKMAIINERYVSGSEGIKQPGYEKDVELLISAINNNVLISDETIIPRWINSKEFDGESIKYENYGSGSTTYKYALSMIVKYIPSIATGAKVDKTSISKINDLNIHHIFPKGNPAFKDNEFINSIGNLTPLEKKPNIEFYNDAPLVYLNSLLKAGKITENNLDEAFVNVKQLSNIESFIDDRSEKIAKMLNEIK